MSDTKRPNPWAYYWAAAVVLVIAVVTIAIVTGISGAHPSGNSGGGQTGYSNSPTTTGSGSGYAQPTISESVAYNEGYQHGQSQVNGRTGIPESEISFNCQRQFPGDPVAQSAYYNGCIAGARYSGTSSSGGFSGGGNNSSGGASDVQPYSGGSGGGAGDVQPYSGNS